MSELRWNPLDGRMAGDGDAPARPHVFAAARITVRFARQNRAVFRPKFPKPDYDIVVFENKFPSLSPNPPAPAIEATELYPVKAKAKANAKSSFTRPNTIRLWRASRSSKFINSCKSGATDFGFVKISISSNTFLFSKTKAKQSASRCIIRTGRFTLTRLCRRAFCASEN
jgi:hypothetical protein